MRPRVIVLWMNCTQSSTPNSRGVKEGKSELYSSDGSTPNDDGVEKSVIQRVLALVLFLCGPWLACAQYDVKCSVCQETLTGRYHMFDSPALAAKVPVCETCIQLETVCFICSLPVKSNYETLEDGRLLTRTTRAT